MTVHSTPLWWHVDRAGRTGFVNIAETECCLPPTEGSMFQRLLLAIDDSPSSELALAFTSALATRCSASVHVFHVNELQVGGQGAALHTRAESAQLVSEAVELLQGLGIQASGSVCVASYRHVAKRIVASAADCGADAIVLGSRRKRGYKRLFSARVRERTTRLTPLPVLAAPSPLETTDLTIPTLIGDTRAWETHLMEKGSGSLTRPSK